MPEIRALGGEEMDPDVEMIEQGDEYGGDRGVPQGRYPKQEESVDVHAVVGVAKDAFFDKGFAAVRRVEVVDAKVYPV